jgi:hypothetical protein
MCSSLQINSSHIFGGWTINAGHLDSFQRLVKRGDAHKTCALLWMLLAEDI